jgi:hypothetical protein
LLPIRSPVEILSKPWIPMVRIPMDTSSSNSKSRDPKMNLEITHKNNNLMKKKAWATVAFSRILSRGTR